MAAIYPWFKFYPSEWMMGRIQRQTPSAQSAFLRLCCKYWHNECILTSEEAELECGEEEYGSLLKSKIVIQLEHHVNIKFLDEQMAENKEFRDLQSYRGKCSAAAKKAKKEASTTVQPDSTTVQPPFNTGSVLVQPDSTIKNIEYRIENNIDTNVSIVELPKATTTFEGRCLKFIQSFNEIRGSKFRVTDQVKTKLKARLKTHTPAEILAAVTNAKKDNFHIENSYKYLTPEYILRSDILEKYLNIGLTTKKHYDHTALPL